MVNAGRVACLIIPFFLTIAALVCIILVFLGGSFDGNKTLDDLYFAKVNPIFEQGNKDSALTIS